MGGLGDSLLVYPVLEILTKSGYEVTVWGNPEYFKLAVVAGFCRKALFYQPEEYFDLKIFFTRNRETFEEQDRNTVFIDPIPKEKIWVVEHYLRSLNFKNSFSKTLSLPVSVEKSADLCLVHPGSGSKKKNPEIDFFFETEKILKSYGFNTLYLIGPAQKALLEIFKNSVYLEDPLEIAKLILKASLYLGVDSGVSHLSGYLGVPSIIIYGPTDPLVWHPLGENILILRDDNCPPCFPNICEERKCLKSDFLISQIRKKINSLALSL